MCVCVCVGVCVSVVRAAQIEPSSQYPEEVCVCVCVVLRWNRV